MGTSRRQYTEEFKRETLGLLADGRPARHILRRWGLPLRGCALGAIPHAGADLAAENVRLQRKNERLRMERRVQFRPEIHRRPERFKMIAEVT